MPSIDFSQLPLAYNLLIFAISAALVWVAGGRLTKVAGAITDRTALGSAFVGGLLPS